MAKHGKMIGNKNLPHISLHLEGRFNARYQEIKKRIIDIAWEKSYEMEPGLWAVQLIDTLENCGVRYGWEFQRSRKQTIMLEFGPYFFYMLLEVQIYRTYTINSDIDVLKEFGLARSEWRRAETRAQITKVTKYIIDWMNIWNIGEEDVVHGPMEVVY